MTGQRQNSNPDQRNTLVDEIEDEIFGRIPIITFLRQIRSNPNTHFSEPLPGANLRTFPNVTAPVPTRPVVYDDETLRRRNEAIERMDQIFRCSDMVCAMTNVSPPEDTENSRPEGEGLPQLSHQNACIHSEIHGFICIACGRFEEVRIFF